MLRVCDPEVAATLFVAHCSSQSSRKKRKLLVRRLCRCRLTIGASINPGPSFPNQLLLRLGSGVNSGSSLADDHYSISGSSKVTPILKALRHTTRHGSFSLSSGTINVNAGGIVALRSESSNAAPVTERSRMVQGVLSPPYSICAGFETR